MIKPTRVQLGGLTKDEGLIMNLTDAKVFVAIPDIGERRIVRDGLRNLGFEDLRFGDSQNNVERAIESGPPDLLVLSSSFPDCDILELVSRIRNSRLGSNPFITVMTFSIDSDAELVGRVINSGSDDLIIHPFSVDFIEDRVDVLINHRKPFVVTSDYIGPDRRSSARANEGMVIPQITVPNALRDRVEGTFDKIMLKQQIEDTLVMVDQQRLDRHSFQIPWLLDHIIPAFNKNSNEPIDDEAKLLLVRLYEVCKDTKERVPGTPYGHIGDMCDALMNAINEILTTGAAGSEENRVILSAFAKDFAHGFNDQTLMFNQNHA
jgi:DNA-binding response OmpR family regulator